MNLPNQSLRDRLAALQVIRNQLECLLVVQQFLCIIRPSSLDFLASPNALGLFKRQLSAFDMRRMVSLKHEGALLHSANPVFRQFGRIQKSTSALNSCERRCDGVCSCESRSEAHFRPFTPCPLCQMFPRKTCKSGATRRRGMLENRKRVAQMMRDDNLLAIQPRRFVITTNSTLPCRIVRSFLGAPRASLRSKKLQLLQVTPTAGCLFVDNQVAERNKVDRDIKKCSCHAVAPRFSELNPAYAR